MKKAMWFVSLILFVITGIVLGFLPDKVPMHYNAQGVIDRWGQNMKIYYFRLLFWQ